MYAKTQAALNLSFTQSEKDLALLRSHHKRKKAAVIKLLELFLPLTSHPKQLL